MRQIIYRSNRAHDPPPYIYSLGRSGGKWPLGGAAVATPLGETDIYLLALLAAIYKGKITICALIAENFLSVSCFIYYTAQMVL